MEQRWDTNRTVTTISTAKKKIELAIRLCMHDFARYGLMGGLSMREVFDTHRTNTKCTKNNIIYGFSVSFVLHIECATNGPTAEIKRAEQESNGRRTDGHIHTSTKSNNFFMLKKNAGKNDFYDLFRWLCWRLNRRSCFFLVFFCSSANIGLIARTPSMHASHTPHTHIVCDMCKICGFKAANNIWANILTHMVRFSDQQPACVHVAQQYIATRRYFPQYYDMLNGQHFRWQC